MMPIDAMGLGLGGVDVDTDPLDLDPQKVVQAQNATHSGLNARTSALIKRPGLGRLNGVGLGAPILGGVEVPLKGTASAPSQGGGGTGLPGDSGDTGNPALGTGVGPGGTIASSTSASSIFSSGSFSKLFNGKRLIAVARADSTGSTGVGWWVDSTGFADTGIATTIAGTPYSHGSLRGSFAWTNGSPAAAVANGVLFYPAKVAGLGNNAVLPLFPSAPVIRRNDGQGDTLWATIPPNAALARAHPTGAYQYYINSVQTAYGDGNTVYLTVYDRLDTPDLDNGRVFSLSTLDGTLTELFNSVSSDSGASMSMPYVMTNFLGRLWLGGMTLTGNGTPAFLQLVPSPSSYDGFTAKTVTTLATASISDITSLAVFSGAMFIGTTARTTSTGTLQGAILYQQGGDLATGINAALTASGGTLVTKNGFVSMAVFSGALYASWFNPTQASKIYKTTDGLVFSTVVSSTGASSKPYHLVLDPATPNPAYMYGVASGSSLLVTTDGTTWTDQIAKLPQPHGDDTPLPMLFGFDQ